MGDQVKIIEQSESYEAVPEPTTDGPSMVSREQPQTGKIETFNDTDAKSLPASKIKEFADEEEEIEKVSKKDSKTQTELMDAKETDLKGTVKEDKDAKETDRDNEKDKGKETKEADPKQVDGKKEIKGDEQKPNGRKIKGKIGEEEIAIDPETEIRVKVQGKYESVKVRDVVNKYSGQVVIEREFQKLSNEKKSLDNERQQYLNERNEIVNYMQTLGRILDDPKSDPLAALNYFVDISGRDPLVWNKKVMDYQTNELMKLENMTAEEKSLYLKDKEIQVLRSKSESMVAQRRQQQERAGLVQKVDAARQTHGVTEDQYVDAHNALVEQGYKESEILPDQVIRFAVMQPYWEKAENITEPYEGELVPKDYEELTAEVARLLKEFPHFDDKTAFMNAAKRLGFEIDEIDEDLEELENKAKSLNPTRKENSGKKAYEGRVSKVQDVEVEMFD